MASGGRVCVVTGKTSAVVDDEALFTAVGSGVRDDLNESLLVCW